MKRYASFLLAASLVSILLIPAAAVYSTGQETDDWIIDCVTACHPNKTTAYNLALEEWYGQHPGVPPTSSSFWLEWRGSLNVWVCELCGIVPV